MGTTVSKRTANWTVLWLATFLLMAGLIFGEKSDARIDLDEGEEDADDVVIVLPSFEHVLVIGIEVHT